MPRLLKIDSGSITFQQLADDIWTATTPDGPMAAGASMEEARRTLQALLFVRDQGARSR